MKPQPLCILVGLTASGKKTLGTRVAERIGAEIISLDSIKIYRGMDIGSAKPKPEEQARVPYHLLDIIEPHESFSIGRFLLLAKNHVSEILARGKRVLFLGGTPFYLNGLLNGLIEGVEEDPDLRRGLLRRVEREGAGALHAQLTHEDPDTAAVIHPNDAKRIVRALEVIFITGHPLSWLKAHRTRRFISGPFLVAGLRWPMPLLRERIAKRTRQMIEEGFIDEVEKIRQGKGFGIESGRAIGYRQIICHLEGELSLEEAIIQITTATSRFAKKQMTWYKRFDQIRWFDVSEGDGVDKKALVDRLVQYFTDPQWKG
jgi:tRNA dimethylallyltransferase